MKLKKVYVSIFFIVLFSCTTKHINSLNLYGDWQVINLYQKNKNHSNLNTYVLNISNGGNSCLFNMTKRHLEKPDYFKYTIDFNSNINKFKIEESSYEWLNLTYDMYIDTIQDLKNQKLLKLTLDHEDVYIEAVSIKNL